MTDDANFMKKIETVEPNTREFWQKPVRALAITGRQDGLIPGSEKPNDF